MKEKWKLVDGFESYEVSNLGRVRSVPKVLKPYINKAGYAQVVLYKNRKSTIKRVNRLVAQAFIPNPLNLPQVNHIKDSKLDNRVSSLEWRSYSGHGRDKALRGQGGEGVHFDKYMNTWVATYYSKTNNQVRIGCFTSRKAAKTARDKAMKKLKASL